MLPDLLVPIILLGSIIVSGATDNAIYFILGYPLAVLVFILNIRRRRRASR